MCASPSTCPAWNIPRHTRAGQFQDMLGIEEGIKRRKEKRQYTRRIIKAMTDGRIAEEKEHYFFQNRKLPLT
jgi:hypothetical protein